MKSKFFFKGITGITNKSLMSLFFKEIKTDLLKLTRAIGAWTLFFKEQQQQFTHSCYFFKSDKSDSLPSLFKKEQLSEERWEPFALGRGHKMGEKLQKPVKNIQKNLFLSSNVLEL